MKDLNIQIAIKIYEYEELNAADRELLDAARQATYRSYAPYSHFPAGKQYHRYRNQSGECSLSVGALRGTHHFVLCQLPISRPGCGDTCHSRPQRTRRVPGRTDSPVRRLPAGDARNGKTFQTSHAHTAVRRKRHL